MLQLFAASRSIIIGPGHKGFYETYESCRIRVLGGWQKWTLTTTTLGGLIQDLRHFCEDGYHRHSGGDIDVFRAHLKIDLFTLILDPDLPDKAPSSSGHEGAVAEL